MKQMTPVRFLEQRNVWLKLQTISDLRSVETSSTTRISVSTREILFHSTDDRFFDKAFVVVCINQTVTAGFVM